jgi:hypothetical protein
MKNVGYPRHSGIACSAPPVSRILSIFHRDPDGFALLDIRGFWRASLPFPQLEFFEDEHEGGARKVKQKKEDEEDVRKVTDDGRDACAVRSGAVAFRDER